MEAWSKEDCKQLLVDPVFSEWLMLTHCPSSWVHDQIIKTHFSGIHSSLMQRAKAQEWIKESLKISVPDWAFFQVPLAKLLLLPESQLRHIARALGLLCFDVTFDKIIERALKQALLNCLPRMSLDYIGGTAPYLVSSMPNIFQEIRQSVELWDGQNKVLIDLSQIGQLVLKAALEQSAKDSGLKVDQAVLNWHQCLGMKIFSDYEQKSGIENIHLSNWVDQSLVILIQKFARHLEPSCQNLLN